MSQAGRAMRPNGVRFHRLRLPIALAVGWATLTLAVTVLFDRCFFAETTLAFRLNAASALVVPAALLGGMVALVVWVVIASRRVDRPRVEVRAVMIVIALIGLGLGTARWWVSFHFATVYAPGFSDDRFRQIRIGMTPSEVVSILADPIRKKLTSERGSSSEQWIYSEPPPGGTIGDNYWRRWIFFENNKVFALVDDYHVD